MLFKPVHEFRVDFVVELHESRDCCGQDPLLVNELTRNHHVVCLAQKHRSDFFGMISSQSASDFGDKEFFLRMLGCIGKEDLDGPNPTPVSAPNSVRAVFAAPIPCRPAQLDPKTKT
jgi:hypothetical protein